MNETETLLVVNNCKSLVLVYFQGDEIKTKKWFEAKNPLLGNVSPNQMIAIRRVHELDAFIKQQLFDRW